MVSSSEAHSLLRVVAKIIGEKRVSPFRLPKQECDAAVVDDVAVIVYEDVLMMHYLL